jgi:hypothetical protein
MVPFQTENGSPGYFLLSAYHLLIVQTEVCNLFVCVYEETNGIFTFTDRLNGLAHL